MRELNAEGKHAEVTVLTTFYTTLTEVFDGDPKGAVRYLKLMVEKYRGRGLPVVDGIDLALVVKVMKTIGGGGGASSTDSETKTKLGEQKAKINEMKTEITGLRESLTAVKKRLDRIENGGEKADGDKVKPCGYCGVKGHYARDCPKKKEDE